jgi:PAS domain S-box-containing protein
MDAPEKIAAPEESENALRQKQGQLLEALRMARLAYWEYDVPNDKFIFNDEFYSLLRTTAEREGGYTMSSAQYANRFVHPDDLAVVGIEIQKALAATDPNYSQQLDHRIIYADGEVGFFNVNIRVEKDARGRTIKTHGANMDISERKRVEEELRRTVSLLQSTFNSTANGLLVVDRAGKIVSFNERFVSLWKIPREILDSRDDEAALGFVVNQLKNPDAFLQKVHELYKNPDAESFDILEFKDGRVIERYSRPQRLDGVPIGRVWSFRDDTERKRAEEELRGKTALFEAQLNSSIDGILIVDNGGKKIIQNQRTIDLWKIPQNIVDENDDEKQVQFVMNRTKSPQQFVEKVVYLYSHPDEISQDEIELTDGTILDRYSSPIIGKDGKHYGRIWSFRDITERKRVEEMSAAQQRLLDGLITAIPDLIYFKDRESRFIRINEAYARRAKLADAHAALGKTDFDIFGEEHARQAYEDEQQIVATGQPIINKEERENWPDGRITWATSTKLPLFDSNGKIVGIMGISRDITERKQAEDKLAYERQLLRTLIDLLPEIFYVKDTESRFLMANEALAKSFGKDHYSQVLGLSDVDFFPPEMAAVFRAEEEKVLAGEPLIDHEENVIFPDGRKYTLLTTKVPFHDSQGRICGLVGIGRDFTERKRSEETIANERQLLRTLIDLLPETFHVKDMDSRFLMVNEALAKRFGKDNYSQVLGLSDADFFPPEVAASYRAEEKKVLAGEPLIDHEGMVRFPDGREYMLMTSKVPFRDIQGRICGLVGIGRDITERKLAEEALARERNLLRAMFDVLPDYIYLKDEQSRFVVCNNRRADDNAMPVAPNDLIGKTDADFFPHEQAAQFRADDLAVLGGKPIIDKEETLTRSDGSQQVILTTKLPFRDSSGKIVGLVGYGRDITERKRTEEELRENERKYRELVEHANSIIIRWTPDGRVTFLNEFGQKFFGYSADEIRGRHVVGTIVPKTESTNRDLRSLVNQISADPKSFEQNINENQRRNGQRVWIAWTNKAVFDEQGKVKEILSIGSDITEQKKLEEQFRQSQKMEAIGQLSGGVAHDFNNILTVIQGNASLLLNAQLKPDEKSECSMQIIRAAERAADLTRQLLMFSRKQVMQPTDLNLNDAVKHMTKMLQRILGEDITLQSNYAPDLPPIHADAGMVEQVLLNLVVNARDAMPSGGQLTIITGVEMVDEKQAQQNPEAKTGLHVRLTVTDTGCGIAPEILPRIFEPFFTTKEIGKGTGLGLATVYGIVHQHHGWITVTSEINKGTTFRIYFPALAGASIPKKSAPIISQFARGTETVLVVEDEPPVRLLVNNLLQRCGYNVLQAESGVAALNVWREHKDEIQLLLTDIIMPDSMTGLELAGQLQADNPKLKIIYTSGYSGEIAGKNIALVEGVNFLKKPYQPETLTGILRKNLDRK